MTKNNKGKPEKKENLTPTPLSPSAILAAMSESADKIHSQTTVWEQWLSRLGVASKLDSRFITEQFEALQFLSKHLSEPRKVIARLGRLLNDATDGEYYFAYTLGQDKQLQEEGTSLPPAATAPLLAHPDIKDRLQKIRPSVTMERIKERTIAQSDIIIHYLTKLPIGSASAIAILHQEPINRESLRFLHLVHNLLQFSEQFQRTTGSLLAETERFHTLTHHLSEGLLIVDSNLAVRVWNRPLQRLTGYSPKETVGRNYRHFFAKETGIDWLSELISRHQDSPLNNVFYEDFELVTKERKRRWINLSGSFLRDGAGRIQQAIVIVRDISRAKELESRKNEFISIATHELRTPITAIKGYLSLLEKEELNHKQVRYLARAIEANDRLARLSEDLLQVIHVEENRLRFSLRPTCTQKVLEKVAADFAAKAKAKGLALELHLPVGAVTIAADPVRFEQVVANVLDNAIKYSNHGRIVVSLGQGPDNQAVVEITDQGMGMDSKDIELAFDKFHRGNNGRRTRETGAGLGLFIVKNFVEKQNGSIKIKSRVNEGTTFQLSFPVIEMRGESVRRSGVRARKQKPNIKTSKESDV